MNGLDHAIVRATQGGLPLAKAPYRELAATLQITEEALLERLRAMLADGRIRRIGAVPNHYRLGYRANAMSVWDVEDEAVDRLGTTVGALSFVSHCYRRPRRLPRWPYNLFAMVHGRDAAEADGHVQAIRRTLGAACRAFDALYSTRILKKTGLRLA